MTRLLYAIPETPREVMTTAEFEHRRAALVQRHPTMFNRLMHEYALQIEPGWFPLIELLCEQVHELLPPGSGESFHWVQIKEKFGGLRAYFDGGPTHVDVFGEGQVLVPGHDTSGELTSAQVKAIRALVTEAQELSFQICQWCGARGELRNREGYLATLCSRCNTRSAHPLG